MTFPTFGYNAAWKMVRPTASTVNAVQPQKSTLTLSGQNKIIPVVYGEDRVAGLHLVAPRIYSTKLVMAVAWSWGEIEGVQTLYANGAALPGGVTVTHYTGSASQTADATLTAAISGFNDDFQGIAYTVFQVPTATITGFPGTAVFEAVVRGRKLYDPRDGLTAWSENPALMLYDFITSTVYGPGLSVTGTDACADRCDELLGGVARCEAGITLAEPMSIENTMDLLSTYAEALWSHDGGSILLVPDAPVDAVDATLTDDDIIRDSLRLSGADLGNQPTLVRVVHREDSGSAEAWTDAVQEAVLPGDVSEIVSEVRLPDITRASEAYRKALSRLRRLGFSGRYEWTAFDDGVKFQRGDVVQLPDYRGLNAAWVRVMSITMVDYGRYRITAEHYDASMYPDDFIPDSTTTIPVGGVIPFISTVEAVPSGWDVYADADNLLLVGKGASTAVGDTGGSSSFTISGTTGSGGYHDKTADVRVRPAAGTGTGAYLNLDDPAPSHTHAYSKTASATPNYRRQLLIQKTGTAGEIPEYGGVLADGELVASALTAMTTYVGRLMGAGEAASGGTGSPFNTTITPAAGGAHDHRSTARAADGSPGFGSPQVYVPAPDHTHPWRVVPCTFNVKRRRLAHYVASSSTDVIPGAIVGYDSVAALPSGWYECDGSNGTVDLRDYFIEFSTPASAGSAAGNNTITWDGETSAAGAHDHDGALDGSGNADLAQHASETSDHTHTVSGSVAYTPPYYVLKFIQYTGTVEDA